jgi:ribonuclease D
MPPALRVTTASELADFITQLSASDFVALDTEFMRESTYHPKLCLVQAASETCCALIDPLALTELQPLWEFLQDRARVKVLHAARQDLEVVSLAAPALPLPGPIFDTQIAAALLGHPSQIGYGALVEQRIGHALTKGHARTDWSRRPLTPEQIEYAADDVRLLVPLYRELHAALQGAGRLQWLYEETAELEDRARYQTLPQEAWRRLKALDRMRPQQRAVAKLLAQWRETLALEHNKPRGWILADETLREIAERLPLTTSELSAIRSLPPGVVRKRGKQLVAAVEQGKVQAAHEPDRALPQRPPPEQVALVAKLMDYVRAEAERLKINSEVLATRRDIEQLVFAQRNEELLQGWRRELIGEQLVAMAKKQVV